MLTILAILGEVWARGNAYASHLKESSRSVENITEAVAEHANGTVTAVGWLLDSLLANIRQHGLDEPARPIPTAV